MKKPPIKRIYARVLADGKISVGEYVSAKWNNIIKPFKPSDEVARQELRELVALYHKRHPGTPVHVEGYRGDTGAADMVERILR